MLIKECEGCKYLKRIIALGLGVRCNHPDRRPKEGLIPVISTIDNCELKEVGSDSCIIKDIDEKSKI